MWGLTFRMNRQLNLKGHAVLVVNLKLFMHVSPQF